MKKRRAIQALTFGAHRERVYLSGGLAGIAGIVFAFYTNSISPSSHGNFFELYGIAAAVLGGCSLRGGEGSILGIVTGTALLQILQNLVNLLGVPSLTELCSHGCGDSGRCRCRSGADPRKH